VFYTETMTTIREYNSKDLPWLEKSMEIFQDGLIESDLEKMLYRSEDYGKQYTAHALKRVVEEQGVCYIAEQGGSHVGFIMGIVHKVEGVEAFENNEEQYGEVIELYVEEAFRGTGLADELMKKLEVYLKEKHCNQIYIEVFAPNEQARKFYEKCEYHVRDYVMMKKLNQ